MESPQTDLPLLSLCSCYILFLTSYYLTHSICSIFGCLSLWSFRECKLFQYYNLLPNNFDIFRAWTRSPCKQQVQEMFIELTSKFHEVHYCFYYIYLEKYIIVISSRSMQNYCLSLKISRSGGGFCKSYLLMFSIYRNFTN